MKNKSIFFISVAIVLYLLFLYLNGYVLKLNYVLIGALQELLTIPVLLLQVALFVLVMVRLTRTGSLKEPYLYGSFSLLSIGMFFVVSSFFYLQ